ncbi:hypothetical protein SBA5_110054 [Candidatus Sulfotelmatomonas gaucii]|uniref:Uncharacterized protein n=1 Tax=Candidatus Sulfuritelmatomonas gaucii TaxID=2043161 RepID=A0A2N9L3S4_9BACT|nr:hypothetical protein SBA5_110054 [Candidatus Sulfotelmatomonas gaucii]
MRSANSSWGGKARSFQGDALDFSDRYVTWMSTALRNGT